MGDPDLREVDALRRAEAEKAARRYGSAAGILASAREAGDTQALRRAHAYALGAMVEYRLNLADALATVVPPDILERLRQSLDTAIAIDATIPDLHWDVAVIHCRFLGDHEQAAAALDRATVLGMRHARMADLKAIIDEGRKPELPDRTPAGELRCLLFRLVDAAADGDLRESGPPQSPPASFADFVAAAQTTARGAGADPGAATGDLLARFRGLRDAGLVTADALDFGLEFVFRAAEAGSDDVAAREALDDLGAYLAAFSFHVSGGDPERSNFRKAIRIARRGLDIVAGTAVPLAPGRHADLFLALGQGSARPGNLRLHDALQAYTEALRLKREASAPDDVARLEALLEQMLDYAIQLGVGAGLGFGALGEARRGLEAAFAAAKELGDKRHAFPVGLHYNTLASALAQPQAAIKILDELLAGFDLEPDERLDLLCEKAMRLSEARKLAEAARLHEDLSGRIADRSDRDRCIFWNSYSNVLRDLGQPEEALIAIDRAMDLRPDVEQNQVDQLGPMLHANRSAILLALGRLEEAKRDAEEAARLDAEFPLGEGRIRIGVLQTRIALAEDDHEAARIACDTAVERLHERITVGGADPVVWMSMLQEWSRLDGLGVASRIRGGTPAEETLAFAEAAKGRLMRLLTGGDASEAQAALTAKGMAPAVARARDWVRAAPGRRILSFFCSTPGLAVFSIHGPTAEVEVDWFDGPIYDAFRDEAYFPWEIVADWSLDQGVQRALSQRGAPPELLLTAAESMSHLLLDRLGGLMDRLTTNLDAGGTHLVLVPHRVMRSLPLAHARLPGGAHLSELYDEVATATTLEAFARELSKASIAPDASEEPVGLDLFLDPQDDLPFARLEGALARECRILVGWQATKQEFRRSLASGRRVLLSAHGEFVPEEPWSSRIVFHDGPMTLADVVHERGIESSLLILSCCEAGLSQRSNSDEPFGFPALLQTAGVASLIAPVWRVDDLATCLFVTRLEQELSLGKAPARALAAASHWLRTLTAHQTLERLHDLEVGVGGAATDPAMARTLAGLERQKRWLESTFAGPETPFQAPLFWAGFQYFGMPSGPLGQANGEGT